jgi:hypothetical protein
MYEMFQKTGVCTNTHVEERLLFIPPVISINTACRKFPFKPHGPSWRLLKILRKGLPAV